MKHLTLAAAATAVLLALATPATATNTVTDSHNHHNDNSVNDNSTTNRAGSDATSRSNAAGFGLGVGKGGKATSNATGGAGGAATAVQGQITGVGVGIENIDTMGDMNYDGEVSGVNTNDNSNAYDGQYEGSYEGSISDNSTYESTMRGYVASAGMPAFSIRGTCSGQEGSAQAGGNGWFFGLSFGDAETFDCEVRNNLAILGELTATGIITEKEAREMARAALTQLNGFDEMHYTQTHQDGVTTTYIQKRDTDVFTDRDGLRLACQNRGHTWKAGVCSDKE